MKRIFLLWRSLFVVYPREPHGISERAHQLDVLKRVRRWFDRWLLV
jgi:dipeptidyl aminopeptidase/acylaminoacyl peptidase